MSSSDILQAWLRRQFEVVDDVEELLASRKDLTNEN